VIGFCRLSGLLIDAHSECRSSAGRMRHESRVSNFQSNTNFSSGGHDYLVQDWKAQIAPLDPLIWQSEKDLIVQLVLATVITCSDDVFSDKELKRIEAEFAGSDDVWIPPFLQGERVLRESIVDFRR